MANAQADQGQVWSGVELYRSRLGARAETGDLQAVQQTPEAREAVEAYRRDFRPHWRHQTVGMVVARYGVIVGADIFCNAGVFREHRERILDSYAVDCYSILRERRGDRTERFVPPPGPSRREAERFLRRVYRAEFTELDTPGLGRLMEVRQGDLRGLALVRGEAVLHAGLFAAPEFIPLQQGPQPGMPPVVPVPWLRGG